MQDRYFEDEELVAFLDGEDSLAPSDEIHAALRTDAALQSRLDALEIDKAALSAAFGQLVPTTIPNFEVAPKPSGASRWIGAPVLAGAIAASLALGAVVGSWWSMPRTDWLSYVAAYQALYSANTLSGVTLSEADQQVQLDRVGAAIGKDFSVDDLTMFPEADYVRAQILSFEGRPLAQIAFLTSTGDPLALCIIRANEAERTSPAMSLMEGLSTATWREAGYEYILIGGTNDDLVERMAATFAAMQI